jgi:hypothetical protein
MPQGWKPKNWEEVCKRNAGRRKLHMQHREERAKRIVHPAESGGCHCGSSGKRVWQATCDCKTIRN